MEDLELKKIWQNYDQQLEHSLALNMYCIREIQTQKASASLRKLLPVKWFAILFGIGWVYFIFWLIVGALHVHNYFFAISAGIHMMITVVAILVYLQHVVLIYQADNAGSVLEVQRRLAQLKTSTLQIARLSFLQMPVFTTFYLHAEMFHNGAYGWWAFQIFMTCALTFLGVWLYFNISYRNANKKWFRILFNSPEWTQITKAMAFLDEIKTFKQEQ